MCLALNFFLCDIFLHVSVLGRKGHCNKISQTRKLINDRNLFPTVLEAWKSSIKVPVFFLVYNRHPLDVSHMAEGVGELSGVSLIQAIIPFRRVPPLRPKRLPKSPCPDTIISTFQHMSFRETQTFGTQQ